MSKTDLSASDIISPLTNRAPDGKLYFGYGYTTDSFSKEIMKNLYGITDAAELCSDYSVYIAQGELVWEIHIFRLRSLYDKERVSRMLEGRIKMLKIQENEKFSPENYMLTINNARIFTVKNIVALLITDDNGKYIQKIADII